MDDKNYTFIVGAGRSGTTLLYKLLCLDPKIAYISNYDSHLLNALPTPLLSRFISKDPEIKKNAWFNTQGNAYYIGRNWIKKIIPTPVEGEAIYKQCGVPEFPEKGEILPKPVKHRLNKNFHKILTQSGAAVFVSKRTANNRRIVMLHDAFPNAKFIHLVRDGRDVAHSLSTVDWLDDMVLPWKMRTVRDMVNSGASRLSLCAEIWNYGVHNVTDALKAIPESQVLQLKYESFISDPLKELNRVSQFLNIKLDNNVEKIIDELSISYRESLWDKKWSDEEKIMVTNTQREMLHLYQYV